MTCRDFERAGTSCSTRRPVVESMPAPGEIAGAARPTRRRRARACLVGPCGRVPRLRPGRARGIRPCGGRFGRGDRRRPRRPGWPIGSWPRSRRRRHRPGPFMGHIRRERSLADLPRRRSRRSPRRRQSIAIALPTVESMPSTERNANGPPAVLHNTPSIPATTRDDHR